MNQLSASLKETYANMVQDEDYIPVKGEVCVAKYTVDQVTCDGRNYLVKCFNLPWLPTLSTPELFMKDGMAHRLRAHSCLSSSPFPLLFSILPSCPNLLLCLLVPKWLLVLEFVVICVAEASVYSLPGWNSLGILVNIKVS